MTEGESTCSSGARHARAEVARDSERGFAERPASPSSTSGLPTSLRRIAEHAGYAGRTCQTYCRSSTRTTSPSFYRVLQDGTLQCPATDGGARVSCATRQTETSGSPIGFSMYSTPEWPAFPGRFLRDEGVCSLSDVLVRGSAPLKYYLSTAACKGILRRAERRGKELPPMLKEALAMQAVAMMGVPEETEE